MQQIPALSHSRITYDDEIVAGLKYIGETIPQNETLAATANYPQTAYFTNHEAKAPWVKSERALVQFMWKNNCSYLLVPEYTSEPAPDSTPLLLHLAERTFEGFSNFYAKYISVPKQEPDSTPLLNASTMPRPDNIMRLDIRNPASIKGDVFEKLFEKILDYDTEGSVLHLYHLRSNITSDNLYIVTDNTRPTLSVFLPTNGTTMQSEFGVLHVNITGSASDAETKIKRVEVSVGGSPFKLANARATDDWSSWSFSDIVTGTGTKRILVRATDDADNKMQAPIYITIR